MIRAERALEIRSPKVPKCGLVAGQRAVMRINGIDFPGLVLELADDLLRFRADDQIALAKSFCSGPSSATVADVEFDSGIRHVFSTDGFRPIATEAEAMSRRAKPESLPETHEPGYFMAYDKRDVLDWEVVRVVDYQGPVLRIGDSEQYKIEDFSFGPAIEFPRDI